MADSRYYYNLYKQNKKNVEEYDKKIKYLEKIKNNLTSDFYDEQGNINNELENLKDDLKESVRHDPKFTTIASECKNYKEKSVTNDKILNNTVNSLEDEIDELRRKKDKEEQQCDSNYGKYKSKKAQES